MWGKCAKKNQGLDLYFKFGDDVTGIGSVFFPHLQTPLDKWLVVNLVKKTSLLIDIWKLPSQHLQEENSKAEDVHLGGLLVGVVGFRGSIHVVGVARNLDFQSLEEVDCAIV